MGCFLHHRGVAQFGRVPALGAGCRRFESCRLDHFLYLIASWENAFLGPVAQLGERSVRIREVESSNLFRSTRLQELPAKGKILTSVRVFLFPQKHFDSQKRKSCLWSCRYSDASRGFFFWLGIPGVVGTASYVWDSLVVMVIALRRASRYTWVNTKGRSKQNA